ncbi:hypothetical protein [Streptomyces sp. 6N223]|uniref:hypothetical protein n=1 Tax=Streptomyces sp. 6N223 TaxID=3457412 RepID=UPI003FD0C99E
MSDAPQPAHIAALLTGVHARTVTVERWQRLEPWAIARARLGPGGTPGSVIVKWLPPHRLRTEVAALRFLAEDLGLALAPRVVAVDEDAGYAVLEDLAPRTALDRLLRRDGAAAHAERLVAFARARGALGAATARRSGAFRAPEPGPARYFARLREAAYGHAASLGAPLTGRAASDLAVALGELDDPGPFLALSNNDAEANNCLVAPEGPADARLIDFEHASYAHALTDAVCLHVPGPAWMSVGEPAASGLAGHYRRALARGVPEAEDDRRYGLGLAAACLSWALVRLERFPRLDTRPPGLDSRGQLVATLEAAARAAEAHRALPALAGWARRTASLLRRRWPDADRDFTDPAAFPPYAPRRRDRYGR